eukprot:1330986-Pleurochrysis_carterae.AAC.3
MDKPPAAKTYVNAFSAEMSPARGGQLHSDETDTVEMMHKPSQRSAEITGARKSTSSASPTGLCVVPSSLCQRSNGFFSGSLSTNLDKVARVLLLVDVAGWPRSLSQNSLATQQQYSPTDAVAVAVAAAVAAVAVAEVGEGGSAEALSTSCSSAHVYRSAKHTPSFLKAAPPQTPGSESSTDVGNSSEN